MRREVSSTQPDHAVPTSVFVGATSLLIDCADIALGHGWHVVAVVSEDDRVTDWAKQRQIHTVGWSDFETDVDVRAECLFSLVNPRIVGRDVLDRFRFSANFHDALLPGHRGVNCAAWALAAGDGWGGVTWHALADEVDAGDTLCQGRVRLREDDTAFSVSLRCAKLAATLFPRLLVLAADPSVATSALSSSPRGEPLHLRRDSAPNGGVLLWTEPAWLLRRLVQATDSGPSPNTFGSALMVLTEGVFCVVDADDRLDRVDHEPGTVLRVDGDGVAVACGEGVLVARRIVDGNGSPVAPTSLRSLRPGAVLRTVSQAEVRLVQQIGAEGHRQEIEAARLIRAGCSGIGDAAGAPTDQRGSIDDFVGRPGHAVAAATLVLAALTGDERPRFALGRAGEWATVKPIWHSWVSSTAPVEVDTTATSDELIEVCRRLVDSTAPVIRSDLRLRYGGRLVPRWDFAIKSRGRVVPAVGFELDLPMPAEWPLTVVLADGTSPDTRSPSGSRATFFVENEGRLRWSAVCSPIVEDLVRDAAAQLR